MTNPESEAFFKENPGHAFHDHSTLGRVPNPSTFREEPEASPFSKEVSWLIQGLEMVIAQLKSGLPLSSQMVREAMKCAEELVGSSLD